MDKVTVRQVSFQVSQFPLVNSILQSVELKNSPYVRRLFVLWAYFRQLAHAVVISLHSFRVPSAIFWFTWMLKLLGKKSLYQNQELWIWRLYLPPKGRNLYLQRGADTQKNLQINTRTPEKWYRSNFMFQGLRILFYIFLIKWLTQ